ncbi:MAG: hypothetical protein GX764_00090, partial [Firmicutes bacterium]|nr:hypothetical protein [Bacillota bacterium]
ALSTGADAAVVVVMQTARMLSSIIIFPFVFRRWMNSSRGEEEINDSDCGTLNNKMPTITNSSSLLTKLGGWVEQHVERIRSGFIELQHNTSERLAIWGWMALSFAIAVAGGFFFLYLEVPAGAMLGAMVFIVSASLIGIRVVQPPKSFYPFMLIGVGLMVADNIGAETLNFLVYGGLFEPVLLSTLLIVLSSILVAYLVHKATQWDFPTCFLAAAPGGFTTMTTMALNFGKDPLRVSILHLFRLLALKVVVPLIIMFFF